MNAPGAPSTPAPDAAARLRITETFVSLQGEADAVGWPTFFIRLTGCPLRCHYCDTTYAFQGGEWRDIDELVAEATAAGVRRVCVTGGEPLAQPRVLALLERLCDAGLAVSLETAGAHDIAAVDPRVTRVVDVKTPGSGEVARNCLGNLPLLRPNDQLKFVIVDRADYEWSRDFVARHGLGAGCQVLFSPGHGTLPPAELAEWILADRLPVRFQLQLHKILWGEVQGR
jgi:7-carboxy-7-deazaguanine synthase